MYGKSPLNNMISGKTQALQLQIGFELHWETDVPIMPER